VTIGFGYDAMPTLLHIVALNGIDTKIVPGSDLPEISIFSKAISFSFIPMAIDLSQPIFRCVFKFP